MELGSGDLEEGLNCLRPIWFIEDRINISPAIDHANDLRDVVCRDAIENHMWVCDDGSQSGPHFVTCAAAVRMIFQ